MRKPAIAGTTPGPGQWLETPDWRAFPAIAPAAFARPYRAATGAAVPGAVAAFGRVSR
ncbi:MAG: hypothetical protein NT115_20000 [Proteobacteria bacterium]|nr:hypothetical protein [Pseudomonadota bacterium]